MSVNNPVSIEVALRSRHNKLASRRINSRSTAVWGSLAAIEAAFKQAGIQFIEENGGGEGLRLRKPWRVLKQ